MLINKVLCRNGLTLIELIVVMAILAIIFTITMPALNNYLANCRLEAACLELQQNIRSTAQDALVEESIYYRINLYRNTEKYRVINMLNRDGFKEVTLPKDIDLVGTNFYQDVILFSARGMPTTGGTVTLKSNSTGRNMYVIVAPVTGRTRVSSDPPIGSE